MTDYDDLLKVLLGGGLFGVLVIVALTAFLLLVFEIFPRIIEAIK